MDIISEVILVVQGNHLAAHQGQLQSFLRLRIRNSFAMMHYENKSVSDVWSQHGGSPDELSRRSQFRCTIWTVGNSTSSILAIHVECFLENMNGSVDFYNRYQEAVLGVTNRQTMIDDVRKSLEDNVTSIASKFFDDQIRLGGQRSAPRPLAPQRR